MSSLDQFVRPQDVQQGRSPSGPVPVRGKADIPKDAPPGRRFRVEVVIVSVAERVTSCGNKCFFLKVRDPAGGVFFVVAWDWQWARLREGVGEGGPAVLVVRAPAPGRAAFTLA